MFEFLPQWIVRHRLGCALACVVFALVTAAGTMRVGFSNDYRVYFDEDNTQLKAFEDLQRIYAKSDEVFLVLAPKDRRVFTRTTLDTIEWLTREAWTLPYASRVDSITNFARARARGDQIEVRDLVANARSLPEAAMAEAERIALAEPLLVNRLISPSGHVTGVYVTIILPEQDSDKATEVAARSRALADEVRRRDPNIDVYLTGGVIMDDAFGEYAKRDLLVLVPVMYLVILVVAFVVLRSWSAVSALLVVMLMSMLSAIGLAGWAGIAFTAPSASAPTIITTIAFSTGVHLLVGLLREAAAGSDRTRAMMHSLSSNLYPAFLTSLTTVIGFLALNVSDVPPFRDLGNIVAAGVISAFFYSIFLLPGVMAVLPWRATKPWRDSAAAMAALSALVVRCRWRCLLAMLAVVVVLFAFAARNEFDDMFVEYFDATVPFRSDTDFAVNNLTGIYQVHYSLDASGSGDISEPAYLAKVDEFARWYRAQPGVKHVSSVTDVVKRINQTMNGDDPSYYRLPQTRAQVAQLMLLHELSLPQGMDLNDQINVDRSASRLTVTLSNLSSKAIISLDDAAQRWLRENAPASMFTVGTGSTIMFSYLGERNNRSMIVGNLLGLLLVSAVLMVVFRSLRRGLISLVPNLVPAGMAFGLWGMLVGEVGLAVSVVTSMTFGIIVDDTIHFMSRYIQARDSGKSATGAVRWAFAEVGMAAFTMSVALTAGFCILALSAFQINADMGTMSALTFALALVADLLLLPVLLITLEGNVHEKADPRDTDVVHTMD